MDPAEIEIAHQLIAAFIPKRIKKPLQIYEEEIVLFLFIFYVVNAFPMHRLAFCIDSNTRDHIRGQVEVLDGPVMCYFKMKEFSNEMVKCR